MSDLKTFTDAVRGWILLVEGASDLPLPTRIEAFTAHLVHLYGAGLRLPPSSHHPEQLEGSSLPSSWPGFGALEGHAPTLTTLLHGITSDLAMGLDHLEQDPQAALTWWRSSFEHRWGTLAAAALPRLHLALQQTRAPQAAPQPAPTRPTAPPPDPSLVSSNSAPPLLQHVPEPPTRRSTGRARPRADSPGVLGLRCEPEERGLRVSAVHPQGPAAGQIEPGDLLLLVDGAPLGGLTAQAAQAALASASDQLRDLDFERGGERRSVSLTAVAPSDLQPSLSAVRLLLLDQDAAYGLFGALVELGIAVEPDPDHDAVVVLQVPPAANAALRPSLQLGADRGIWEVLPRA